jgi:hypothetical protein
MRGLPLRSSRYRLTIEFARRDHATHSDDFLACNASYRCLYKRKIPSLFIGLTSRSLSAQTSASTRSGE